MIEAVRRLRNYRDSVGVPAGRADPRPRSSGDAYGGSLDTIARLARFDLVVDGGDGEVVGSIGLDGATVEVLPSDTVDPAEVRARIDAERKRLRAEIGTGPAASSPTRASPTRRRRSWCRPSATSSSASSPSWPSWRGRHVGLPEASPALRDAERYLDSLELFGMRFGLERMRRLMTALDSPQERFAAIHVLGTNGKSSTARMIAALLEQAGARTGAYLSPHLVSFAERIEVGGSPVSDERFAAAIARAADAAAQVDRTLEAGDRVTQFEALTAAAYWELARAGVEVAVVEAGLGGRYDATSVIRVRRAGADEREPRAHALARPDRAPHRRGEAGGRARRRHGRHRSARARGA